VTTGPERWLRITAALSDRHRGAEPILGELCRACAETLLVAGAGISLMGSDDMQASMGASGPVVARLEELEFTLGHGPCTDAYARGAPVLEPDLVHNPPMRWTGFTESAIAEGIHAVFSFPLHIGAARLGAMALYRDHPGPLSLDTYADAFVMADVVTRTILAMHGGMPEELLMATLRDEGAYRAEVHQASGMISVQLQISVGDALARLRARAFSLGQPIGDVAADVVGRRLKFNE
jgi:hypothetical protein